MQLRPRRRTAPRRLLPIHPPARTGRYRLPAAAGDTRWWRIRDCRRPGPLTIAAAPGAARTARRANDGPLAECLGDRTWSRLQADHQRKPTLDHRWTDDTQDNAAPL